MERNKMAFFIELDSFPALPKGDVDAGKVPRDIAETCDTLRAIFFTSNAMRKERDAWFYTRHDRVLLRFNGSTMRYLGPDERSMLMLLLKAKKAVESRRIPTIHGTVAWRRSTPGIEIAAGVSRAEAWAACTSTYPTLRSTLLTTGIATSGMLASENFNDIARRGCIACVPRQGDDPPAPGETFITLRVASHLDATSTALRILLFNLLVDTCLVDSE